LTKIDHINSKNYTYKWHIQKEDNHLQNKEKEDRTIMLKCLPWQFVPIAAPGIFIILYAANADITEENWQSKKR